MSVTLQAFPDLTDLGAVASLHPAGFPRRDVRWGHVWQVGTPSYWIAVTEEVVAARSEDDDNHHRLGVNLTEEVAACLLGGFGMPYEVGLAAFRAIRDAQLLREGSDARAIEAVLSQPLQIGERSVRYRFPAQRARYLAAALQKLGGTGGAPTEAAALRDWLLTFPGVGPKTASWIVRNHLRSDDVAIIDIHVQRAGVYAGIFDPAWQVPRDYHTLEAHFLAWADQGGVRAADLDSTIWSVRAYEARARYRA